MQRDMTLRCVSHRRVRQLFHNKFIVVLGDSIQRSVYKDLVLLLQKDNYLSLQQLKTRGEMSFELDCLVEGGCLSPMHNGKGYREVRQFQSAHHLVRFYFVTRIYSHYMESILEDFRQGLKPDVVVLNSCVWDISRYNGKWPDDYKDNLKKLFYELKKILPEETLVVWNLTMPLGDCIKGGFLVPEIEHKVPQLRYDVIEANFYSGTLANAYGMDVLDLHFHFRLSLQHRTNDGVHWNALAHRKMSFLLFQHCAQAWGVIVPCPLTTFEHTEVSAQRRATGNRTKPAEHPLSRTYYSGNMEFASDSLPPDFLNFERPLPPNYGPVRRPRRDDYYRHPPRPDPRHPHRPDPRHPLRPDPRHPLRPDPRHHHHADPRHPHRPDPRHHHEDMMRSHHARHHYAPHPYHRPDQYNRHHDWYY